MMLICLAAAAPALAEEIDVTALYNFILYNDSSAIVNGDQNGDGVVTGSDVTAVYNIILGL